MLLDTGYRDLCHKQEDNLGRKDEGESYSDFYGIHNYSFYWLYQLSVSTSISSFISFMLSMAVQRGVGV